MLIWAPCGALELRRAGDGSARLVGRFPYGAETELAPGRLEVFAPRALEARDDVLLLSQHEFAKPLASVRSGSLTITNGANALEFEARITTTVAATGHARDVMALIEAGLAVGVSPGFRVPKGGEAVERRGEALLRTVTRAELIELSIVTQPAYGGASVQARCWTPGAAAVAVAPRRRWRA